jgi:hypothetical protein
LRLIFTFCHPAIDPKLQVPLTLREVCGLTTKEIARALLTSEATMAQRMARGKTKIRETVVIGSDVYGRSRDGGCSGWSSKSLIPEKLPRIRMLSPRASFQTASHWALSASDVHPKVKKTAHTSTQKRFISRTPSTYLRGWSKSLYSLTDTRIQQGLAVEVVR